MNLIIFMSNVCTIRKEDKLSGSWSGVKFSSIFDNQLGEISSTLTINENTFFYEKKEQKHYLPN